MEVFNLIWLTSSLLVSPFPGNPDKVQSGWESAMETKD